MAKGSRGTKFETEASQEELVQALLDTDNSCGRRHGPGGYEIYDKGEVAKGVVLITFTERCCAPAMTFPVFIEDGSICAGTISLMVGSILSNNKIIHKVIPSCEMPSYVTEYYARITANNT